MKISDYTKDQLADVLDSDDPPAPPMTRKRARIAYFRIVAKEAVATAQAERAAAESKLRVLHYGWLLQNRCFVQHLRTQTVLRM